MFNPGGGNDINDDPFYLSSLQKNQEDQGINEWIIILR